MFREQFIGQQIETITRWVPPNLVCVCHHVRGRLNPHSSRHLCGRAPADLRDDPAETICHHLSELVCPTQWLFQCLSLDAPTNLTEAGNILKIRGETKGVSGAKGGPRLSPWPRTPRFCFMIRSRPGWASFADRRKPRALVICSEAADVTPHPRAQCATAGPPVASPCDADSATSRYQRQTTLSGGGPTGQPDPESPIAVLIPRQPRPDLSCAALIDLPVHPPNSAQ